MQQGLLRARRCWGLAHAALAAVLLLLMMHQHPPLLQLQLIFPPHPFWQDGGHAHAGAEPCQGPCGNGQYCRGGAWAGAQQGRHGGRCEREGCQACQRVVRGGMCAEGLVRAGRNGPQSAPRMGQAPQPVRLPSLTLAPIHPHPPTLPQWRARCTATMAWPASGTARLPA